MEKQSKTASEIYRQQNAILHKAFCSAGMPYEKNRDDWMRFFEEVTGRKVNTLFKGTKEAGWTELRLNASGLSSGIYFYRITADGLERGGKFTDVGKMVLLK